MPCKPQPPAAKVEQKEPKDLFRDTWVRYLGYANEVGESFRKVIPVRAVRASYVVAFAYVLADTGYNTLGAFTCGQRGRKLAIVAGDVLLWQTLASVIIPGFTINRICAFTHSRLGQIPKMPRSLRNVLTIGVGLGSIPIIILPIDKGVDIFMNNTYRRYFKQDN